MMEEYLVEISTTTITPFSVSARSEEDAMEQALSGRGMPEPQWTEEPQIHRIQKIEN